MVNFSFNYCNLFINFCIKLSKKFETGDKDLTNKDFWKYSCDIRKFKKSIWEPKETSEVINKKIFRDRLVNCYWTLILIIFFFSCYLFTGIGDFILS